ncbi:MAG: LodA/GoxA family CTQ-dependent oxidase [Nostocaceae cyanobacterium]|nr:LodA/GoxA family CTQ-dependent oxidase [Nostocaceae cyanobacterium]
MADIYKIFPAIGIARVGNSEEYYLAPESPGGLPILSGGGDFQQSDFRDGQKKLRRQGARFRIYRYPEAGGAPEEVLVGANGVEQITWTVRLANKKSNWYEFRTKEGENGYSPNHPLRNPDVSGEDRKLLAIDPGSRTLTNVGQSVYFDRNPVNNPDSYPMIWPPETLYPLDKYPDPLYPGTPSTINRLGEAHTDTQGHLIVVGGFGRSGSDVNPPEIHDYANNDNWWDDTSDGPISAQVVVNGETIEVSPAWVLVGPPAYAPEIVNLVTLYDTIFDVAVRYMGARPDMYQDGFWQQDYQPDYVREIKPILDRASMFPWVVAIPPKPHTFNSELLGNTNPEYNNMRQYFFDQIRAPNQKNTLKSPKTGYPMMPYLAGDDATGASQKSAKYFTLTDTQYFLLGQWVQGKFTNTGSATELDPGEELTRAALVSCVGGPFSPGIEMSWISRNPKLYTEPFRIKHKPMEPNQELSLGINLDAGMEPGDVTKFMALPWQADFNECSTQTLDRIVWWWPAQRPYFVYLPPEAAPRAIPDENLKDQQVPWVGTDYDQKAADYVMFANDLEMVEKWDKLGFVLNLQSAEDPYFVEVERILPRD